VLRALHGHARVPAVLAVCDDPSVIGAPFYVLERLEGHVVTSAVPPQLDSLEDRRRMGDELVDGLVEIHAVDWQAVGLEGFGKPTGYLERQLRRFTGLWEHNRTRDLPTVERVGRWLAEHLPDSPPATVVHGDYRLGNVMLAPDAPARMIAVFDWEMATIGDPLADLGYLATFWVDRDDPPRGITEMHAITRQDGFPLRDELVARYEEQSGRAMTDVHWYRALATWKLIVFMEGNYKRALSGSTDDPYLKTFGEAIDEVAADLEKLVLGS
jgi:aminoglycoside phosphotransferase (APT) family kinase protein